MRDIWEIWERWESKRVREKESERYERDKTEREGEAVGYRVREKRDRYNCHFPCSFYSYFQWDARQVHLMLPLNPLSAKLNYNCSILSLETSFFEIETTNSPSNLDLVQFCEENKVKYVLNIHLDSFINLHRRTIRDTHTQFLGKLHWH